MTKSYESYINTVLYNRAMSARRNTYAYMSIRVEASIYSLFDGREYITPVAMAHALDCDVSGLCSALSRHKASIGKLLLDGNYGNCNTSVAYTDKVYLQGWVNFLSLPCFSDSKEAEYVVDILDRRINAA